MSEKKFDKYYVDSDNANRMRNIFQFINNCEFNNIKEAQTAQTKTSKVLSGLLKKYFNGQFKFSDLLILKAFVDQYNLQAYKFLFSDDLTIKPADPFNEMFQVQVSVDVQGTSIKVENISKDLDCFYNRYIELCEHLKKEYEVTSTPPLQDIFAILYGFVDGYGDFVGGSIEVNDDPVTVTTDTKYAFLENLYKSYILDTGIDAQTFKNLLYSISSNITFDDNENPLKTFFDNFLFCKINLNDSLLESLSGTYFPAKSTNDGNTTTINDPAQKIITTLIEAILQYSISFILRYFIFSAVSISNEDIESNKYFPNDTENLDVLKRNSISYFDLKYKISSIDGLKATSGNETVSAEDLNSLFNVSSGSVIHYTVVYKENNNYLRDVQKSSIYESLLGIYFYNTVKDTILSGQILLDKEYDTVFEESCIFIKNGDSSSSSGADQNMMSESLKIYCSSVLEIVRPIVRENIQALNLYKNILGLDVFNDIFALIFNMHYDDNPDRKYLFRYYKSNPIYSNIAEDLDIVGFTYGDYTVSGGFGYGTLLENSVSAIDLFLSSYETVKNYFMTVLHNYAYSSEEGYRAYAFLNIISQAISLWNDHFQKNIFNVDYYNSDVINSFLKSFGLENIAKQYIGISDDRIKLKIIQNYTKLMQEKGTADVIKDLSDILRSDTVISVLKPIYIARYNNAIIADDKKFIHNGDDRVVFFPGDLENDDVYNNIDQYLQNMESFESVVDSDPYWDSKDVNEKLILDNFSLNVMPTKYLKRENLDTNQYRRLLVSLLLSGARFTDAGLLESNAENNDNLVVEYIKWCKQVLYIYEFILVLYTSRGSTSDSGENSSETLFPPAIRKIPYLEGYDKPNTTYYGVTFDGFKDCLKLLTYLKNKEYFNGIFYRYTINIENIQFYLNQIIPLEMKIDITKTYNNIDDIVSQSIFKEIKEKNETKEENKVTKIDLTNKELFNKCYASFIGYIYNFLSSIEDALYSGNVKLSAFDTSPITIVDIIDYLKMKIFRSYSNYTDGADWKYNGPIYSICLINDVPRLFASNKEYRDITDGIRTDIATGMRKYSDLSDIGMPDLINEDDVNEYINILIKLDDMAFSHLIEVLEDIYIMYIAKINNIMYDNGDSKDILFRNAETNIAMLDSPAIKYPNSQGIQYANTTYIDILKNFLPYSIQLLERNIYEDILVKEEISLVDAYKYSIKTSIVQDKISIIDEQIKVYIQYTASSPTQEGGES